MKILFNLIITFLSGTLFGIGLYISGMIETKKIVSFLDIFGKWDPSLIFVMVGAISIHAAVYFLAKRKKSPVFAEIWDIPSKTEITKPLIIGSFIFGAGWALGG